MREALEELSGSIEKNVKIFGVYSMYLKIVEMEYPELLLENI